MKIKTLFSLFSARFLLQVMEDKHSFKLEALPHKPLLFLNAPNEASLKALLLGKGGPSKQLYDISTLVKLDISPKVAGIEPDSSLWERFNISKLCNFPSCSGIFLINHLNKLHVANLSGNTPCNFIFA